MQLYGDDAWWYYFANDHLGTPQKVVDASGSLVWEAGYLPFGEARLLVADIDNNLRFPGQYYDSETGLHYNWHRYYDPESGRYWTADPIGLDGGINLYAYCLNDPMNWGDTLGLESSLRIIEDYAGIPGRSLVSTSEGYIGSIRAADSIDVRRYGLDPRQPDQIVYRPNKIDEGYT